MAETSMVAPAGEFTLHRPHAGATSPLRAWSAADEYVLHHLTGGELGRVLVVNDAFGALAVGLAASDPVCWSDSVVSRSATDANLGVNSLPLLGERAVPGDAAPSGSFDTIVVRIPKSTDLLAHQLTTVRRLCRPTTTVVGTGMVRHVHRSTIAAFEAAIGPTTTSRAVRKARLLFAELAELAEAGAAENAPAVAAEQRFLSDQGVTIVEMPGTFSAGHVDVGTSLLLAELSGRAPALGTIVDLGCGNGIVGAHLGQWWSRADVHFVDASDLAVRAARATWASNGLPDGDATFTVADGLGHLPARSAALVVSNPPFHHEHAVDRGLAERLLADAARVVTTDGVVVVVSPRQLEVHRLLGRLFENVTARSAHPTHVVVEAANPKGDR